MHEALEEQYRQSYVWLRLPKCVILADTAKEIAETLDVTERTVQRDWDKARLILAEMLR